MVIPFALLLATGDKAMPMIGLEPLGSVRREDLTTVSSALESFYKIRVLVLPSRPLPNAAYYEPRGRYRAEKLLEDLNAHRPKACLKVIGLTASDISTSAHGYPDWGIFGLGNLSGSACVVSTFRFSRSSVSVKEFRTRLSNVVRHELGHTFGLPHCPTPGCVMADAEGSIKSIQGKLSPLCGTCRVKLGSDLVK